MYDSKYLSVQGAAKYLGLSTKDFNFIKSNIGSIKKEKDGKICLYYPVKFLKIFRRQVLKKLTIPEAAIYLGKTLKQIQYLVEKKRVNFTRVDFTPTIFISISELERLKSFYDTSIIDTSIN